ncbi:hypothetical protein BVI2075_280024 [Burkholderia vietnamiensis]|nr:hypothetical protein BVI2075_280024 [Burkholderia vietnamiensis]
MRDRIAKRFVALCLIGQQELMSRIFNHAADIGVVTRLSGCLHIPVAFFGVRGVRLWQRDGYLHRIVPAAVTDALGHLVPDLFGGEQSLCHFFLPFSLVVLKRRYRVSFNRRMYIYPQRSTHDKLSEHAFLGVLRRRAHIPICAYFICDKRCR